MTGRHSFAGFDALMLNYEPSATGEYVAAVSGNPVSKSNSIVVANPTSCDQMEDVYRLHYDLLLYVARRRFRVPAGDAESLIQEVFVSYLSAANEVRDIRAWLLGAISNASRHYWRLRGRTESLPDDLEKKSDPHVNADNIATSLTVRETLAHLHEKCRETLRLRYFEGCSAAEVAKELDTTNRYAEKLIHNCLKRAYQVYRNLAKVAER
jgi:RNA polymerase sigma factor (sigma-70 family)